MSYRSNIESKNEQDSGVKHRLPDPWPEQYSAAGLSPECPHQMHWDTATGTYRCIHGCGKTDEHPPDDDTHRCHRKGLELSDDDRVLFDDRKTPLTVTGRHTRQRRSSGFTGANTAEVIELEGNGTEYHLVCISGAPHGPMLYRRGRPSASGVDPEAVHKKSEWDYTGSDAATNDYHYVRGGERIQQMQVFSDDE